MLLPHHSHRHQHIGGPVSELLKLLSTVPGIVGWIVTTLLSYYNHNQVTVERQIQALFVQKKFDFAKSLCKEELQLKPKNEFLVQMEKKLDAIEREQIKQDTTATSSMFDPGDDASW